MTTFSYEVVDRQTRFTGAMFDIVTDEVTMPGGSTAKRDYMRHVGAVGVVALDADGRVVLIRQYRHPAGAHLWELPAGLIDIPGEPLEHAAARELAEEVDLVAADWQLLTDLHTSPGCSNEVIRLFVARGLSDVEAADRHHREDEEADLTAHRVPLDDAVAMVFRGEITNAAAVVGVLGAARLRDQGWPATRPLDVPLPRHET
jgi:8-oxo-dGTP pyrophosphatase MutT (NUDIX family)